MHELADWIADFREHIERLRVAPNDKPGAIREQLPKRAPEEGEPFERILSDVDNIIVPGMVHWSHPMFLGYFGWTSTAPGILGEILTAPLNVNAMTWRTCPAATELETVVIDWLRQWVGLSDEFDGVIYDTASVGIMHALAVAREEAAPATRKLGLTDRNLPRLRIYTSDQAHSSAEKAAIALGVGEENVIRIPSDDQFRIDVNSLGQSIAEDRQNGLQPMAVVATVGTTSTASVDPVRDIGNLCREAKNLAAHRRRLRWWVRDGAGVRMDEERLGAGGFDRDQSAQNSFCASRFQRALCARPRTIAARVQPCAGIFAW